MKTLRKCKPDFLKAALNVAFLLIVASVAMAGSDVFAAEVGDETAKNATAASVFDTLWALPVLYSDERNPIVQRLALIGRYHGQYYRVDADEFGSDSDWDNRRTRLGIKIDLLRMVSFEGQMNVDVDDDRSGFFDSVEDLYVDIEPSDAFGLSVGKHKPYLTYEWTTSSNRIKTIERSLLVNQIIPDKIYGVAAFGKGGGVTWRGGLFSGTYSDRWELPDFDGGYLLNVSLGCDVGDKRGQVRLDYLYNDGDRRNFVATRPYQHSLSLNYNGTFRRLGVVADLIYADGSGEVPDVWGIVLMPYYKITDKLEGVFRYTYADSDAGDGIRLASRYERRVDNLGEDRGENYHSAYAGANYYIYGDRLKLMAGVEYSTLDLADGTDWNSWTWFGAVRLHF
jgi:phosphate-selective porin OprO and OprP